MQSWFLIQFKPNAHRVAERNLNRQGFKTFLPLQETTKRSSLRFLNTLKPFFPCYLFVSVQPSTSPWRKINNTVGVSRLVCFNGKPKPIPAPLVTQIMSRCDQFGKFIPYNSFVKGDAVELIEGAFAKLVATVETVDSEKRVWIMMELMGQHTRMRVGSEQLKLCN